MQEDQSPLLFRKMSKPLPPLRDATSGERWGFMRVWRLDVPEVKL